jgi:hypothetical protein
MRQDNERVTANPQRIPADADAAEKIIELARDGVTADLLGCLVRRDAIALARYGARQATAALRARSAALLRDALLATAIADMVREADPRDVMISLARHCYVARQLGLAPAEVFDAAVSGLPDHRVRDLFRRFGLPGRKMRGRGRSADRAEQREAVQQGHVGDRRRFRTRRAPARAARRREPGVR